MKSLRKLKFAKNDVRNLRRSPDTSLKEREYIRFLIQRAKNLTPKEPRNNVKKVWGDMFLWVKKNRCQCLVKHGNREQIRLWFCNVGTLKTKKFNELKALLDKAVSLPQTIALKEANSKFSAVTWSPAWRKLKCYNKKNKNMKPDGRRRGMLLCIHKDLDWKEIEEPNGFEKMQLYELVVDGETGLPLRSIEGRRHAMKITTSLILF